MYAPRAKFERIYIVSPIKVAIIFLTSLHCLFILIALLTSFWIETKYGHYGPLFSCDKHLNWKKSLTDPITIECHFGRSFYDINLLWMPITALLIVISFIIAFISIIIASLSFVKNIGYVQLSYYYSFFYSIVLLLYLFQLAIIIISIIFNGHMVFIVVQHYLFQYR
jgi:hypothetical protein